MPADKLELLSSKVEGAFKEMAEKKGRKASGYSRYIDLRDTPYEIPIRLYCGGIHNGVNKLQFHDVAHLGLTETRRLVRLVCGKAAWVRISRLDWCFDVAGISAVDLASHCRLSKVQTCGYVKSRNGITFYLRRSKLGSVLMYDRIGRLRAIHDPLARCYSKSDQLTRIEVQLKGKSLQFRNFSDIERYGELNLLSDISFWEFGCKRQDLNIVDALAADGFLGKIEKYGLQVASKTYSSQEFDYLQKQFLIPRSQSPLRNL
jgi:hypothetical protein